MSLTLQTSAAPFLLPDFDALTPSEVTSRAAELIRAEEEEWRRIGKDPATPTVDNTLLPLERGGLELERLTNAVWTLISSVGGSAWEAVETELTPLLAAHADALWLDQALYARLTELPTPDDPETAWLLTEYLKDFRRHGVQLPDAQRDRLRALNAQIAARETEFEQRATQNIDAAAFQVRYREDLSPLDDDALAPLRSAAASRGLDGWLVAYLSPTQQPLLKRLTDPATRREILARSQARGRGGEGDTRQIVLDLARLRAQRAELLGFPHHAAVVADEGTAPDAAAITSRLRELAAPAIRNALREQGELAAVKERDSAAAFEDSDWAYYEERLRAARYGVDDSALRPYLELDRVVQEGVFYAATQLYGITFHPRPELRGWAPGVRAWEVREEDGTPLALFLADYYARSGKHGGAWMHSIVDQEPGVLPIVANNLNIPQPPSGEPTLLTWDEVGTCFHEFGHALHGMFSAARHRSLGGTNVPRDFVEYPSQVNEMWLEDRQVLTHFARHHVTGQPLPDELVDALLTVRSFGQGFSTSEYLGAAVIDHEWHLLRADQVPQDPAAVEEFERNVLLDWGLTVVPPRYHTTYFAHAFGGGYDAAYYAYIWSEVLDAHTQRWFGQNGGLSRQAGQRFRQAVLSRGNTRDPLESFRQLTGQDPDLTALLERRGLL